MQKDDSKNKKGINNKDEDMGQKKSADSKMSGSASAQKGGNAGQSAKPASKNDDKSKGASSGKK